MTDADPTNPATNTDAHTAKARTFAITACIGATLLFLLCAALLYSTWAGREPATALIVVQGDDSLADATVALLRTTDRGEETYLEGKIADGDDDRLRFHVPPGTYRVRVTFQGHTLMDRDIIAVERGEIPLITLRGHPSTHPAK